MNVGSLSLSFTIHQFTRKIHGIVSNNYQIQVSILAVVMLTHTPSNCLTCPYMLPFHLSLSFCLFVLFILGSYCYRIGLLLHTFPHESGELHRVHMYLFSSLIPVVAGLKHKLFPNNCLNRSSVLVWLAHLVALTWVHCGNSLWPQVFGQKSHQISHLVLKVPTSIHIRVVCGWLHAVDCDPMLWRSGRYSPLVLVHQVCLQRLQCVSFPLLSLPTLEKKLIGFTQFDSRHWLHSGHLFWQKCTTLCESNTNYMCSIT